MNLGVAHAPPSARLTRPATPRWVLVGLMAFGVTTSVVLATFAPLVGGVLAVLVLSLIAYTQSTTSAALFAVLVVGTFPIARVTAAGAPIYLIDLMLLASATAMVARHRWVRLGSPQSRSRLYFAYGAALSVPVVVQLVRSGDRTFAVFGFVREAAAASAFLIGLILCASDQNRRRLLRVMVGAAALQSLVSIAQRVEMGRGWVDSVIGAMNPGLLSGAQRTYPERSYGFLGAPTALSGFLSVCLAGLVVHRELFRPRTRRALIVVISSGLFFTASRQWLVALLIAYPVYVVASGRPVFRSRLTGARMVGLALATVVAVAVLPTSPFVERTGRLLEGDENVSIRLERQGDFFDTVLDDPEVLATGQGFALQDIAQAPGSNFTRVGYADNAYLLEFTNRGVLCGVLLLLLLGGLIVSCGRAVRLTGSADRSAVLIMLILTAVLAALDNYYSEVPFMRAQLWLLLGAGAGCSRILSVVEATPPPSRAVL